MRSGSGTAILAAVLLFAAAPAWADDCPVKSTGMDDIVAAVNDAPNCEQAMRVAEACAYGASADVQFGAAVEKKCEGDFLGNLTAQRKRAYGREMGVCDRKYRNKSGTMYLSATAFCRAKVAQRYSQKVSKQAGPSKAR
jgi:hypothetical protein